MTQTAYHLKEKKFGRLKDFCKAVYVTPRCYDLLCPTLPFSTLFYLSFLILPYSTKVHFILPYSTLVYHIISSYPALHYTSLLCSILPHSAVLRLTLLTRSPYFPALPHSTRSTCKVERDTSNFPIIHLIGKNRTGYTKICRIR
jgi:hypothetical protein